MRSQGNRRAGVGGSTASLPTERCALSHSPFCPASAAPAPPLTIRQLLYDDGDAEDGAEDGGGDCTVGRALDKSPAHEGDRVTGRTSEIKTILHVWAWVSS